jgi:hypothetical protein
MAESFQCENAFGGNEAAFVTGANIAINGGQHARSSFGSSCARTT